ncbi:heme exporter protein CcmB [bacterium]|nr:heme exporter protein CcmB [bacterium]
MKKIWLILKKDLLLEFRTKESFVSMLTFCLLVIVVFNFSFEAGRAGLEKIAGGILWVSFIFAGTLGLTRSFNAENENGCLQGLRISPVEAGQIYFGKLLSNCFFMLLVEFLIFPVFVIFFNLSVSLSNLPLLFLTAFLGTIGFSAVGTLLSAVSSNTKLQEVMLPILLFPVVVPVVIGSVEATNLLLTETKDFTDVYEWLKILASFDGIFVSVCYLIFDFALGE